MLTEQPDQPHKSLVSPFPLQRSDVDFLAGTGIPWFLAIIAIAIGIRFFTGNPYLDIDEVVPKPPVFQVDINVAEWPEIAQLPGVGETLAGRIVAQRMTSPFSSVDQLLMVHGIGDKKMEAIRPFLLPVNSGHSTRKDNTALASTDAGLANENRGDE